MKSKTYLSFLADSGTCQVSGGRNFELHHEAIFPGFSGQKKNKNDFQAIRLSTELHTGDQGVHGLGSGPFWESYGIDPRKLVLSNLRNYQRRLRISQFKKPEDFDAEHEAVQSHIDWLEEAIETGS